MRHRTRRRNRRGTALLEFVMCIPFLALIIASTFLFGKLMRNEQRLRVTDRYVAWREMHNRDAQVDASDQAYIQYGEPDEGAQRDEFTSQYRQANHVDITSNQLNEEFYENRALPASVTVQRNQHKAPVSPYEKLVNAAGELSEDAGELGQKALNGWPHVENARTNAEFPSEVDAYNRVTGAMSSASGGGRSHVRDSVHWRRRQNSYLDPIRELFLKELDDVLQTVQHADLKQNLRDLYLQRW